MTKRPNNKVFFFFAVLISLVSTAINAQVGQKDTLKKVSVDTLNTRDEGELEDKISYSAQDSTVYLASSSKVFLYGKAQVEYGNMNLTAEFIEIDYDKNVVIAYGKKDSAGKNVGTPLFKDGAQEMNADKIMYNLKTKKGKIFNALTKQGELLVVGKEIKKDSTNVIYMKDMRCIPCQAEDARTVFKATRAKIIPDDKIVTGPMFLEIGGVPTPLGLPFGYFPNTKKQHNGILLPQFGNSTTLGYNLRDGGFYWGINDKTDMIIRGDIYANGSWSLKTTNDYNILYKANGVVNLTYSQFNIGDKDIPSQFSKEKTYSVLWTHTQDNKSNPTVRFTANVNYVNNQRINRLNAINSGQFLNNTFQSNINFTKSFKASSLSLNATHSQNSLSHYSEVTFPSLTYNVNRFFPFRRENAVKQNVLDKIGINYLFEARNTLSGADSTLFKGDIENKLRYGIKHSLPISTNFNILKYITVTPAINLSSTMYTKSTRKEFIASTSTIKTDTVSGFVGSYDASFSTSMNTKVFFDYAFRKGKVKQIRHLMIPTLTYSYRPDFGADQYGFYKKIQTDTTGKNFQRYSVFDNTLFGGPAAGKTNALGINLNNNIEAKVRKTTDTGFTYNKVSLLQNISLNTSYNFAADSFKMSTVGISARTKLFKYFDIVANSTFDPYGYDKITRKRVKEFSYKNNEQFAQFTTANVAINTSFGSNQLEAMRKTRQPPNMTNGAERGAANDLDEQQKLPWNVNMYYNLTLNNINYNTLKPTQTLNFSGDIAPTKYWKLGITSGYDFTNKRISYTSINIYRDLKCWEAHIDWVPFGIRKSYYLTINLKSSMLREFKIPKRSIPMDNF
ncbi:MAG: putative LPS assembly protein LptD [Bacteroidia bacterium]